MDNTMSFNNQDENRRVIWLTGCTAGLGRALVDEFVAAGHVLCGCGRNPNTVDELRETYTGDCFFASVDISDDSQVAGFCHAATEKFGAPDLLVNNAAVVNENAPLWEVSAKEFDTLTAVNINGTANMIRHTIPKMLDSGSGVIVNYSSGWGRSTSPEVAPYCATKWAIEGLTQALSQELPHGLSAVALNPGIINTSMLQTSFGEQAEQYRSPEQWASTAAPFLLSLNASHNGQAMTAP